MRRALVRMAMALLALPLAGCLLEEPAEPAGSREPLAALPAYLDEATTQDPERGWHFSADEDLGPIGRVDAEGNAIEFDPDQPMYLHSRPFLLSAAAFEGQADWTAVRDAVDEQGGPLHPYWGDLVFVAITGEHFPERLHDGAVDGRAPSWKALLQAEFEEGEWGVMRLEWADGGWQMGVWSFGQQSDACPDVAADVQARPSEEAFAAALAQPAFAAAREATPDGELWMVLHLQDQSAGQEQSRTCARQAAPTWSVRWLDLEGATAGEGGPYVEAVLDAESLGLLGLNEAMLRRPGFYHSTSLLQDQDRVVPGQGGEWTFDVPPGQVWLHVEVARDSPATVFVGPPDVYGLVRPDGTAVDLAEFAGAWRLEELHPVPGTWTLARAAGAPSDTDILRTVSASVTG